MQYLNQLLHGLFFGLGLILIAAIMGRLFGMSFC